MGTQAAEREQELAAGLSIIHSNHLEDLRKVAVQWIGSHPLKPLENELFIVQSNGMAQWLKLALAQNDGCGISAALDIQLPARFLWNAYRAVLGEDKIPRESPYDKVRLVWRLLALLPSLLEDARFAPLARFLEGDKDLRKRYQLAHHLADLFDQYQVYRADWLEDWANDRDILRDARGEASELPGEQAWQAELWRQIRKNVPDEKRGTSRSALHRLFLTAAEGLTERPPALPRRVIVFGISSLPKQALEALHAVSRQSQVLLFVHNPCRHYWADIIEDRDLLRIERARHRRKAGIPEELSPELLHQNVNPLLAAWGKQGRDYIGLLYGYDQPEEYQQNFAAIDMFSDFVEEGSGGSLLQQVQQAILDLTPLPTEEEEKPVVAMNDHSISFQLAHSRQREVEILQDRLLSFFDTIPGLKPRDVIVMTPDIDTYAPHIEAVFGNLKFNDRRFIPFTIADKPERSAIPMIKALEKLLQLPDSRMTAGDLMDLMEVPAFRERFGLKEADLPLLHRWIEGAGIRWGLSARQRKGFGLPGGLTQNTWLFGLRRMLLGYAVGQGEQWQGIEPYDEIGGLDAALVGPLSAMLKQLEKHWQELGEPATPENWSRRILLLMQDCFRSTDSRDRLIASRAEEVLEQWLNACKDAGLDKELTLPVVRASFMEAMNESSMSQRFLAGMVNFCTLMPMRAIPFKVVCLLGMNDGEYPRSRPPLDFDLMSGKGRYRPGDRSRREDDRYLFLEALLSSRDKLYISYIGRSVRDNSERMPSVLVGQLRDYLCAGWRAAEELSTAATGTEAAPETEGEIAAPAKGGGLLLDRLTCLHPLQPFSRAYFQPERKEDLFTYAREWREILDQKEEKEEDALLAAPLFEGSLPLNLLIRFMKNPVQSFFNQRLKVFFDDIDVTTADQEPFALDNLAPFGLGSRLLTAGREAGPDGSDAAVRLGAERLRRTGELPMGGFGELSAEELSKPVLSMLEYHHGLTARWPNAEDAVEIRFPVAPSEGECEVEDWLDGLRCSESSEDRQYARWEFYAKGIMGRGGISRVDSLVGPWVKHLAGCAAGLDLTSYLVAPDGVAELKPMARDSARNCLAAIIGHWWAGLMQPLPVTARTALAYIVALARPNPKDPPDVQQQKAVGAARTAYEGDGYNFSGERGYSVYLARAYDDFDALWQADGNRFTALAEALYAPLVEAIGEEQ